MLDTAPDVVQQVNEAGVRSGQQRPAVWRLVGLNEVGHILQPNQRPSAFPQNAPKTRTLQLLRAMRSKGELFRSAGIWTMLLAADLITGSITGSLAAAKSDRYVKGWYDLSSGKYTSIGPCSPS